MTEIQGKHYMMYAYAAYCEPENLKNWDCKWCGQYDTSNFTVVDFYNDYEHNLFGYGGFDHSNHSIVVSFRGTEESSLKNWIIDLKASKDPVDDPRFPGAKIDAGFLEAWLALRPQVVSSITYMHEIQPNYDIVITGHSLGGAIASGMALDFSNEIPNLQKNITLVTYGCPRLGNKALANYFMKFVPNNFRFTNNRDIVPHLPPLLDGVTGYHHAPQEFWLRNGQMIPCNKTNGEDPDCSDSLFWNLSVYDHLHYFDIYETCSPSKKTYDGIKEIKFP